MGSPLEGGNREGNGGGGETRGELQIIFGENHDGDGDGQDVCKELERLVSKPKTQDWSDEYLSDFQFRL